VAQADVPRVCFLLVADGLAGSGEPGDLVAAEASVELAFGHPGVQAEQQQDDRDGDEDQGEDDDRAG
jgi:hypothetical protein